MCNCFDNNVVAGLIDGGLLMKIIIEDKKEVEFVNKILKIDIPEEGLELDILNKTGDSIDIDDQCVNISFSFPVNI